MTGGSLTSGSFGSFGTSVFVAGPVTSGSFGVALFAGALADSTKGNADAVYRELVANLIPNSHMVPAGIVAVNRAQERGYTFSYVT